MSDAPIVRTLTICNGRGLHARPSAKIAEFANQFDAEIMISKAGLEDVVTATSVMGLLMLGASKGSVLTLTARGREAEDALNALEAFISSGFGEAD